MSNNHPYDNGYAFPNEQQASARKSWSKLAVLAAVVNGALFFVTFLSGPLMSVFFGSDEPGGEISMEQFDGYMLVSFVTAAASVVLSIAALIINILFFRSLQPVPVGPHVPAADTQAARVRKVAAALLITFPSLTLITTAFTILAGLLFLLVGM
jgi:hypothetical protein